MSNIPISSLPIALSLDGSEEVPIVQAGTTKRTTTGDIANQATGFVPTSRQIVTPTAGGLTGGGPLTADITLNWKPFDLLPKTAMVVADSFAINDSSLDSPAKITFPNAMKAVSGLSALSFPSATADYIPIYHGADGLTYKINPSSLNLSLGNMPAGGLTSQVLTKASNADYDTTWTFSGFVNEPANSFLGGPASGPDAQPTFRLLVGADLPDPAPTTKGGVKSYAAVTNQFLTSIATDGTPASAQPSFSNISGTATVSQGGTGATTFTAHGILLGEGTSAVVATAAMTDGQLLIGQTGANPAPQTVSGDVTISNLGVTAIGNNKVTNAMLRTSSGLSVIGRSASTTGNVADIIGTADQILRVAAAGASVGFGSIDLSAAAAVGSSVLDVDNGGTGISSYTIGDILYASGTTALSALPDVATGNALLSGGISTAPLWGKITPSHFSGTLPIANGGTGQTTATAAFDALSPTTTRGDLIARGASNNVRVAIGSANTVLRTNGTDPAWGAVNLATDTTGQLIVANGGTGAAAFTTNGILYGNNTSPVQVTSAGTNGTVLSGNTGSAPTFNTVSAVLDAIGNTQGNILYRSATGWNALAVGTSGQVLSTQGAGANPQWISATGVGTVTSVDVSGGTTGLTTSGGPITAAGTITLAGTLATANGGTNLTSYTQGDLLYASTSSVLSKLAKDTNATRYLSNTGTTNNPAWAQVNVANGVTGVLPVANGGTGDSSLTAYAVLCGGTTSTGVVQSIASVGSSGNILTSNGASALPTFQAPATSGTVTSVATGNGLTGGTITSTGTLSVDGVLFNTRLAKTTSYTVTNSDKGKLIALGGSAFYTLTFNAASGYDSNFTVSVLNEDTGRGKTIACNGLSSFILYPGQNCTVYNQNNVWKINPPFQRFYNSANLGLFVDVTNGSDSNDGLAAGSGNALQTVQAAINVLLNKWDLAGTQPTIQLANGTYTPPSASAGSSIASLQTRLTGDHTFTIIGDTVTPANVVWNCTANGQTLAIARDYGTFILRGIKFSANSFTSCSAINSSQWGTIDFDSVEFAAFPSGAVVVLGAMGTINATCPYTVSGNFGAFIQQIGISYFTQGGGTVSVPNALTFTLWLQCVALAGYSSGTVTYSGSGAGSGSTGQKYSVTINAFAGLGGSTLPGATAGSSATGGQVA